MTGENTHRAAVAAWLHRAPGDPDALSRAFDDTFAAMWQRTKLTLGEVTLTAIVDRVLHIARDQFPVLGSVELTADGLRSSTPPGSSRARLAEGIEFVLVEFLTVLGNLTADILSHALHAELSRQPRASDASRDDSQD